MDSQLFAFVYISDTQNSKKKKVDAGNPSVNFSLAPLAVQA